MPAPLTTVADLPPADQVPAATWSLTAAGMTEVVAEQWPTLVRVAVFLLGDRAQAQDVVQDVCEATWRLRPTVRDREHLIAYLRAGVVNRCRSAGRRRTTAARYLALLHPAVDADHEPSAEVPLLAAERRTEVLAALEQLADRQREVVVLRYWADLSEAEIADALSISRGTVKNSAHHALRRLAVLLGDNR